MKTIMLILGILLVAWIAWVGYLNFSTPRPEYKVIANLGNNIEIREYNEQVWATVPMESENSGFGILANYIFGKNKQEEAVGMTSPVITSDNKMTFVMPKRYDLDSLPTPNTDEIEFTTVPKRKIVAIKFTGFYTQENYDKHRQILEQAIELNNLKVSNYYLMRYNDPWTPFFLRTIEVAYEIKEKT